MMKPYSRTKRLYYWFADRIIGFIGIGMLLALLLFLLPPEMLWFLFQILLGVAYLGIALMFILAEWS